MLWIGLHLPLLSLESFAATLASASTVRPLALVEDHAIVQADAAARARGVRPGIQRATALALAPDLLLGQADARRDAEALAAVAHAALAFTPSVAAGPEGIRLEVQSTLRYFGGLDALIERLQAALAPLGHRVQLASAPTALGAALLARWRADLQQGPHSTRRGALCALLDQAPVWLLGRGREHWQALQGMGLRTLADLRALPRSGLARRFGPELLLDLDRARGDAPEPLQWVSLPPRFACRLELLARADTSEQVLAGARILLARLVAWAQAQRARIARFTLVMHHEPRHRADSEQPESSRLEIALAEPAIDPSHLQLLLAERLARVELAAPALELSLHCDALQPGEAPNGELFPSRASAGEGLTRLIERLQARLGVEQVRALARVADHRPERATLSYPADPASAMRGPSEPALAPAATLWHPVWLLSEPRALGADEAGRARLNGRTLPLLAGPERIETGWWDGELAARDYFIAAAADGGLLWLYRSRLPPGPGEGSGWFLHGWFG